MSYRDAYNAICLQKPAVVPRTEFSAGYYHFPLIKAVTGHDLNNNSPWEERRNAMIAFEKAWDFGLTWSTLIAGGVFGEKKAFMGHASYAQDGADYDSGVFYTYKTEEEALSLDFYETYGEKNQDQLIKDFNDSYDANCKDHPDQVNMTGIYVTMVSGLLEVFGWDLLLSTLGEDSDGFGQVANRYAKWVLQYFEALAGCKAEVVMVHDDIVWTSGAFTHPKWYRKYIFENYQMLFEPLHKAGKKILFTSDGTYTEFIDDIAGCGISGFVLEPTTDIEYMAKKYGKTHAIIGNADCRILQYGNKDDIKKEVLRCMSLAKDCPGFIMAVGNHLPYGVPVENALYYNQVYMENR